MRRTLIALGQKKLCWRMMDADGAIRHTGHRLSPDAITYHIQTHRGPAVSCRDNHLIIIIIIIIIVSLYPLFYPLIALLWDIK
jgi:hypothetical protein